MLLYVSTPLKSCGIFIDKYRMHQLRLVWFKPTLIVEGVLANLNTAAALNVTEPAMTGIGGDMFCLYFDAKTKQIRALNGSGRSAKNTTCQQVRKELGLPAKTSAKIPTLSPLAVTVPGAAAGWVDTIEWFGSGKVTMEQILTPAIELAENGFPVSELSAGFVSIA